jgi:hypothetical protein
VGGGLGWCRNMRAQRKNSKFNVKVFFKVLKFLSLFSHKNAFFYKNISKSCGGRDGRPQGVFGGLTLSYY